MTLVIVTKDSIEEIKFFRIRPNDICAKVFI